MLQRRFGADLTDTASLPDRQSQKFRQIEVVGFTPRQNYQELIPEDGVLQRRAVVIDRGLISDGDDLGTTVGWSSPPDTIRLKVRDHDGVELFTGQSPFAQCLFGFGSIAGTVEEPGPLRGRQLVLNLVKQYAGGNGWGVRSVDGSAIPKGRVMHTSDLQIAEDYQTFAHVQAFLVN